MPRVKPPAARFVDIALAVMGDKAVVPPKPGPVWWARIGGGLKAAGMHTDEDYRLLCEHVMTWIKTPMLVEILASKAASWFAVAKATHKDGVVKMPGALMGPLEME